MDPNPELARLLQNRREQLLADGDATAVPPSVEQRVRAAPVPTEPEPIGAPVPGAMGVLAVTAFIVSCVLAICRVFGVDIGVVWILAPMWGSALLVAVVVAIAGGLAWVRRSER